jgi:hypothetical protein
VTPHHNLLVESILFMVGISFLWKIAFPFALVTLESWLGLTSGEES